MTNTHSNTPTNTQMNTYESHKDILLKLLRNKTLWVASLGYFVDLFDLVLFGIVRVASLKSLNVTEDQLFSIGATLLNYQMAGLLIGGLIWGLIADKIGRRQALFASIILYSTCNLLNAFVASIPLYAALRFFAGFGLAGELGIAITLVAESVPMKHRGYASTFIAFAGFLGAIFAATAGSLVSWPIAYLIGGLLGFLLLFARLQTKESPMFEETKSHNSVGNKKQTALNNLRLLFLNANRIKKYFLIICTGLPIWYTAGVLLYFSPEIARTLNIQSPITAGNAILISYIGSLIGDVGAGFLSQIWGSRKKIIFAGLMGVLITSFIYLFLSENWSAAAFYILIFVMGVVNGYWALFVTFAAEQFGTNLRATVASSVANWVRGAVIPLTLFIQHYKESFGFIPAIALAGVCCFVAAFGALYFLSDTFYKDLNFTDA